jgi:hypothetical protein
MGQVNWIRERLGSQNRFDSNSPFGEEGERMAGRIYLIHEYNCDLGQPTLWDEIRLSLHLTGTIDCRNFAIVWVTSKPLDPEGEELSQMATKLVGPLPSSQAYELIDQLRQVLEEVGLSVFVEEVADD